MAQNERTPFGCTLPTLPLQKSGKHLLSRGFHNAAESLATASAMPTSTELAPTVAVHENSKHANEEGLIEQTKFINYIEHLGNSNFCP